MMTVLVITVEEEDMPEVDMVEPENMILVDLVEEIVLNNVVEAEDVECLEEDQGLVEEVMVEMKDIVVAIDVTVTDMNDQKIAIMKMDIVKDILEIEEVVNEELVVNGMNKSMRNLENDIHHLAVEEVVVTQEEDTILVDEEIMEGQIEKVQEVPLAVGVVNVVDLVAEAVAIEVVMVVKKDMEDLKGDQEMITETGMVLVIEGVGVMKGTVVVVEVSAIVDIEKMTVVTVEGDAVVVHQEEGGEDVVPSVEGDHLVEVAIVHLERIIKWFQLVTHRLCKACVVLEVAIIYCRTFQMQKYNKLDTHQRTLINVTYYINNILIF